MTNNNNKSGEPSLSEREMGIMEKITAAYHTGQNPETQADNSLFSLKLDQMMHDMKERTKELRCLYAISTIIENRRLGNNEVVREIIDRIPAGMQFPEIAWARITAYGDEYRTDNYRDTEWKLCADIEVEETVIGRLETGYIEKCPPDGGNPFLDEEKDLISTIADLTGRFLERRQSQEMFENLAANSPVGVYIVQDGKFQYVNEQFSILGGYSEEELLGMDSFNLVFPEDKETVRNNAIDMLKGTRTVPYEFRIRRKDGSIIWIMEKVNSIVYRGRKASLGSHLDISELKMTQQKLERAAEAWTTTFNAINRPIAIIDNEFNILRTNPAYVKTYGNGCEDITGMKCYKLVHNTNEPPLYCPHLVSQSTKDSHTAEQYESYQDRHLEFTSSPIRDNKGKISACVEVIRDITEQKKMQEQLVVTDRLAAIGELSSGIAHEINNPLTGIIGFSELLLEKEIPEEIREDLEVINREAKRTAEIVRNLLIFARKHPEETHAVDINKNIAEVLLMRSYEQKVSNIDVHTNYEDNLPPVNGNAFELQQVFINIIINAEFFMTKSAGGGKLSAVTEYKEGRVRISFSDTGPGIEQEAIKHLFDPFFTTKEVGKGTGLGLSICHGIITKHNGRIYAESEPGKGATFIIELPASEAEGTEVNK